jgi:hypothetical protein
MSRKISTNYNYYKILHEDVTGWINETWSGTLNVEKSWEC